MKFLKFNEIDSTNNYMKENIASFENYDIVSAKIQTSGRGRRGNTWLSPEGMALFSFLLKPEKEFSIVEATKLPLLAGISTLSALKKIKDGDFSFKWTNDVFLNSKKLCGILIERVKNDFVVGIGINVANKIPNDIKNIAISMENDYDIDKLILKVVEEFSLYYKRFSEGKWQEIIEEINSYNFLKNKNIKVHIGDKVFEGIAKNIVEDGRIEIEMNGEIKLFSVGEIKIEKDYY
ncbi:biotin--[acetyl-CoA-carboxylase] ligase [Fusobacterium simiae]|uniref:Biotin--[acetyl-CoA-carboxylase] ligase n=1 Tax=Fusobacterium simiae TaxID=855 RepID=A0ABT4DIJ1_FUSSI|nr:biotin--[acetyl-CoA-carboxylase] ligase [Fusobacterium simiae]MCY7008288.1 biotin--[acetyl-CoA-carboxylase] ligase [Fusobacterium simiae]